MTRTDYTKDQDYSNLACGQFMGLKMIESLRQCNYIASRLDLLRNEIHKSKLGKLVEWLLHNEGTI